MRAVIYEDVRSVRVGEVPEPAIADAHDAVVRVTSTAICGSDLHFFHGKAPMLTGDTIGHEAVGVVEETGGEVDRFTPGVAVRGLPEPGGRALRWRAGGRASRESPRAVRGHQPAADP